MLHISLLWLDPSPIIPTNDEYDSLSDSLKIFIYDQGDNNVFLATYEASSSSPVNRLIQTDSNEILSETTDEAFLGEVFPDAVLPNSPFLNLSEGS